MQFLWTETENHILQLSCNLHTLL